MKINFIKRILSLVIISVSLLTILPIGASAEWKQNNNGQWNYLKADGSKVTGWLKDSDGKWYYLNSEGVMEYNTTIDSHKLASDGSWIQDNSINTNTTNNNVNNSNNSTLNNTGIINNGGVNNNVINNYGTIDTSAKGTSDENIILPITIPSNWVKITNTGYAINSRSPFVYQVKDTFGIDENSIIVGLEEQFLTKTDLKYESKKYNGYKADCFEYLDVTQKGIEKFYNITIFNNNKVYNFTICGNSDNYEIDKQDLENVLNSSLKF